MGDMKMAKQYGDNISNRNEQLKNEYERKMRSCKVPSRIVLVFLLIYIAYFFVGPYSGYWIFYDPVLFVGICLILIIIYALLRAVAQTNINAYQEQLDWLNVEIQVGEVLASTLKALPDDYMIFNNVALNYNGELTEIDSIILSCHGIFVVDVKNYKGVLFGLESDDVWSRTKTSKADKSYGGAIKNPVKQVDRKAQIVSNVLYKKGIRTDVDGYVVLPMADKVIVDSDKVFLNIIQLKQTILSKDKVVLSQDKVETIKDILMQL